MSPTILVLSGGESEEREVSLKTGKAVFDALTVNFEAKLVELTHNSLNSEVLKFEGVVYPALHGTWGEDGSLQAILEKQNIEFAGCDSSSSRICFDKSAAKNVVKESGVPVAVGFEISESFESCLLNSDKDYVLKPVCQGSSVGLRILKGAEVESVLSGLEGRWLLEEKIDGIDLTVGVIEGIAQAVIAVRPQGGVYDYKHKYTSGLTEYEVPAKLPEELSNRIRAYAEQAFKVLQCRDFARIDFMLSDSGDIYFLEANTLPGMTETSLLPKSASVYGLSFNELVKRLVTPAIIRLTSNNS